MDGRLCWWDAGYLGQPPSEGSLISWHKGESPGLRREGTCGGSQRGGTQRSGGGGRAAPSHARCLQAPQRAVWTKLPCQIASDFCPRPVIFLQQGPVGREVQVRWTAGTGLSREQPCLLKGPFGVGRPRCTPWARKMVPPFLGGWLGGGQVSVGDVHRSVPTEGGVVTV